MLPILEMIGKFWGLAPFFKGDLDNKFPSSLPHYSKNIY
jgi:hypothetical protein